MGLFAQTDNLIRIIPKSDYMSFQIINIPRSKQTPNCRITVTDNLRKSAMIRTDDWLPELCRFENSHRKPFITTTGDHQKSGLPNKIGQFIPFEIPHQVDIPRNFQRLGHPSCSGKSEWDFRMTPGHLNQQIVSFLITQPPNIGNIIT